MSEMFPIQSLSNGEQRPRSSTGRALAVTSSAWCSVRARVHSVLKRGKSLIRKWQGKQIEVSLSDRSGPQGSEADSFLQDSVIDLNNSTLHLMGCVICRYPCGIHNPSLICQVWHGGAHHYLCDLWRISLEGQFVIHERPGFGASIDRR